MPFSYWYWLAWIPVSVLCTWVTWVLVGGDLYTTYTSAAVPAFLYGAGGLWLI
jgi:hypothetical protein